MIDVGVLSIPMPACRNVEACTLIEVRFTLRSKFVCKEIVLHSSLHMMFMRNDLCAYMPLSGTQQVCGIQYTIDDNVGMSLHLWLDENAKTSR